MFERFSDRAQKVMALANQEANRLFHEYIDTEHILLGLLKEGSGVGANVLKSLGVNLHKVRLEVEKLVKPGPDIITTGKLPQTPLAKKVVAYAIDEARNLDHNYVGTEHLLLGLLNVTNGVAAVVLRNLGVNIDATRKGVIDLLGGGVGTPAQPGVCCLPPQGLQPQVIGVNEGQAFTVLGMPVRMVLSSAQTGGAMMLFEQSAKPGQGVPMHIHEDEDEVFRVLEGQVRVTVNKAVTIAKPGDTVFGPRLIPHDWSVFGDKPAKILVAVLPGTGFETMLLDLSQLPPGPPDMAKVAEICALAGVRFSA